VLDSQGRRDNGKPQGPTKAPPPDFLSGDLTRSVRPSGHIQSSWRSVSLLTLIVMKCQRLASSVHWILTSSRALRLPPHTKELGDV
jgi:hypothetical protein